MSLRLRPIRSTFQCTRTFTTCSTSLADKPAQAAVAPPKPRTASALGFGSQNASRTRELPKIDLNPSSTSQIPMVGRGTARGDDRQPSTARLGSYGSGRQQRQTDGQSPQSRNPQRFDRQARPAQADMESTGVTSGSGVSMEDFEAGHVEASDAGSNHSSKDRGARRSSLKSSDFDIPVVGEYGAAGQRRSAPVRPPVRPPRFAGRSAGVNVRPGSLNVNRADGNRPPGRRTPGQGGPGGYRGAGAPRTAGGRGPGGPGARPPRGMPRSIGGRRSAGDESARLINEIWGQAPIPPPPEQSISLKDLFGGRGLDFSPSGQVITEKMVGAKQFEKIRRSRANLAAALPSVPHPSTLNDSSKRIEVALSAFNWAMALGPQVDFIANQEKIKEASEILRKFVN